MCCKSNTFLWFINEKVNFWIKKTAHNSITQNELKHFSLYPLRLLSLYFVFCFFLFFFGCAHSIFPGWGSNMCHSSDLSHCSDNATSLSHWATWKRQDFFVSIFPLFLFNKKGNIPHVRFLKFAFFPLSTLWFASFFVSKCTYTVLINAWYSVINRGCLALRA